MDQLPCKNCITLAICKATTLNTDQTKPSDVMFIIYHLYNKCELFKEYTQLPPETAIYNALDNEYTAKRIQSIIKYISEA